MLEKSPSSYYFSNEIINDAGDTIYSKDFPSEYVVARENVNPNSILLRMVNKFGKDGGFEMVLDRLKNLEKPIGIDQLGSIIQCFGKMYKLYYRKFALDYLP